MAARKFGHAERARIIRQLLEGKDPKEIAWLNDCHISAIYHIRSIYFTEKWVLKRHPKDTFKLES